MESASIEQKSLRNVTIQYPLVCDPPNRTDAHAGCLGSVVRRDDCVRHGVGVWVLVRRASVCSVVCGVRDAICGDAAVCGAGRARTSYRGWAWGGLVVQRGVAFGLRAVRDGDGNTFVFETGRSSGVLVRPAGVAGKCERSGGWGLAGFIGGRRSLGGGEVWAVADDLAVPRRKVFVHLDGNARGEFGDRGIFAAAASEGRGIYVWLGQRLGVFDSGEFAGVCVHRDTAGSEAEIYCV